jgi:threonine synthase
MGLPIGRLICASNSNDVLTEFINTGAYDRRRDFHVTYSPSMDILISSNLERALYLLSGGDDKLTAKLSGDLGETGRYELPESLKAEFDKRFRAYSLDDGATLQEISATYGASGYLLDPHTAVAVGAARAYREETGDAAPILCASTASPFKFCGSALKALGHTPSTNEAENLDTLSNITGKAIPEPLKDIFGKRPRFEASCDISEMAGIVKIF